MSRNVARYQANISLFPVPRPMFSVVITTLNRASLLERALKSLILQTENDWEAIIIDDGSTDDTCEKIMPLLRSYTTLKYIWKPHSGAVPSRNFGIKSSRGKFVTFLDSDDEYHPLHLEYRRKFLNNNPGVKFLYGGAEISGNPYVPDKNNPSRKINLKDCLIGGTFVIEREVVLSLNGFRAVTLGSDSDMFERIRNAGMGMAEIKFPSYIYHRENQDSITNRLLKKVSAV